MNKSLDVEPLHPVQPKQNMSVSEGASWIGVSERKIREEIALKKLKVVRIGRRIIVRLKDLESYLDSLPGM